MEKWQKANTILLVCILLLTGYLASRLSGSQNGRFQPLPPPATAIDTQTGMACRTVRVGKDTSFLPICEDLR